MIENFMRNVKFGRSIILIIVSLLLMMITKCNVQSGIVVSTFPVKVVGLSANDTYVFIDLVTEDGKKFSRRDHDMILAYVNKGVKSFVCTQYASDDLKCVAK